MTDTDRVEFAKALFVLGETFNESVSEVRAEAYFTALADLAAVDVLAAMRRAISTCRFFPRPAEIREAVLGNVEDTAEIAWLAVVQLVRRFGSWQVPKPEDWPDERTKRAALDLFGGWRGLCENLAAVGTPEFLGTAKQFKAAHAAYQRIDQRELPPSPEEARVRLTDLKQQLEKRGLPTGAL